MVPSNIYMIIWLELFWDQHSQDGFSLTKHLPSSTPETTLKIPNNSVIPRFSMVPPLLRANVCPLATWHLMLMAL